VNQTSAQHPGEKALVASILDGNRQAFATIIKNTEALVAQIVFKMIPDAEERKDVVQDIYLKAFHHLPGFQFKSKLSTWIAQIAYNTCLHYLRKKKPFLLHDHEQWETHNEQAGTTPHPEAALFQKELVAVLAAEIDQLPPVYKTIITLYHNEELSYEEIATITQLPQGTLKSYLFRARKTLKDKLLLRYKNNGL
jgi:RNA polymerase sigma-70 factor (ECF subfamily)